MKYVKRIIAATAAATMLLSGCGTNRCRTQVMNR